VVLNARDAEARGAEIRTRTLVIKAGVENGIWHVETRDDAGNIQTARARMLINAGGPWVSDVIGSKLGTNMEARVRLVRGSHIVTKRLFDHDKCYFFQGTDGRIIFAIPYETDFTLIGTTDKDHPDPTTKPECTPEEQDYLCNFASGYFKKPITRDDIVWTYSGVRPLYDDGSNSATAATRDYTLVRETTQGAPALHIFGGKITTYRRLAESAMEKIKADFPDLSGDWTAGVPMPGGDFPVDGVTTLLAKLMAAYPFLADRWALRLIRAYGTEAWAVLGEAKTQADLGQHFGADLSEAEVRWLMEREYARRADDVVWRRSKLGLRMTADEIKALDDWMRAGQN
jgi:glycerol-3-phosphate dehydrogenase